MQADERDPDQLTIPTLSEQVCGTAPLHRQLDSLGPSRSLPARPAARGHGALTAAATAASSLAVLALFMLPTSRSGQNTQRLVSQALGQLQTSGLALHDVHCPRVSELHAGQSFSCRASAEGVALRIQLTPIASEGAGTIERLSADVEGAVDVADVTRLAAQRFSGAAEVTCPHRFWVGKPGAAERCTLYVGKQTGPLSVQSAEDGELAFAAPWLEQR